MGRSTPFSSEQVTELLLGDIQQLVQELAGSPVGPQIMLYYGPDLLRRRSGRDWLTVCGFTVCGCSSWLELVFVGYGESWMLIINEPSVAEISRGYQFLGDFRWK